MSLLAILLTAVGSAIICGSIPDDEYLRFQLLDHSSQRGVRWVYERTHFSTKPIDVAIVGPSRTGAAIDASRLARQLAAAGRPAVVVNFSLPEEGRDLHWIVAEQVMRLKHPRVMIVGVIEQPTRSSNPGYKFVAPASEIIRPSYLIDLDYPSNLVYLPYRQAYLLFARVFPGISGMRRTFDPSRAMSGPGVSFNGPNVDMPKAELERRRHVFERQVRAPLLPARLADVEFGNEGSYIRRIAGLANQTGTQLVFLYMPHFGGPANVGQPAFYGRYGRVITAGFVAPHDELYYNLAHLNPRGAAIVTDWLAVQLEPLLREGSLRSRGRLGSTASRMTDRAVPPKF